MELLAQLNQIKPVWVELGLQTMHEDTARDIRRGYPLSVFEDAVNRLRAADLEVIVHTILGLPGEDQERMFETLHYLNDQDIQGIKLQLLHILKGTDLAVRYEEDPFQMCIRDRLLATSLNTARERYSYFSFILSAIKSSCDFFFVICCLN